MEKKDIENFPPKIRIGVNMILEGFSVAASTLDADIILSEIFSKVLINHSIILLVVSDEQLKYVHATYNIN